MAMYTHAPGLPARSFLLLGPRGTGKTTWLRSALPAARWYNLLLAHRPEGQQSHTELALQARAGALGLQPPLDRVADVRGDVIAERVSQALLDNGRIRAAMRLSVSREAMRMSYSACRLSQNRASMLK